MESNEIKNYNLEKDINNINNKINIDNRILSEEKIRKSEIEKSNEKNINIIDRIKLNRCAIYFWFCFVRKKKNIHNVLLDEGMDVIVEKLDIMNIFKILHKNSIIQESIANKEDFFEMSEACRLKMQALSKPINNSLKVV